MSSMKVVSFVQHCADVTAAKVWGVNWQYTGNYLVSCGEDRTVKIWKKEDDKLTIIQKIAGDQTRTIRFAEFSQSGKFLATASWDGSVIVYEYTENEFEEKYKLEGHENEVKCCRFDASGQFLATCSRDKTVWVWQVDEEGDYEALSVLQRHSGDVKFVLWHPTLELLLSGGYDNALRLYYFDGADWVSAQDLENAHESTVWAGAYDPSGKYLATISDDAYIKIWELCSTEPTSTSKLMRIAHFHVEDTRWPLFSISWNPHNSLIAVAGGDHKIRIFDFNAESLSLVSMSELKLDDEINSIAWNPVDGNLLAAALDDGTIQVVRISL